MKLFLSLLAVCLITIRTPAAANAPIRLALIAETQEAQPVVSLLTATLSTQQQVQLLERDEVDRVYREQALTAAGRNELKVGRLLGAHGLLLLNLIRTQYATNLALRLIAVQPGVIVTDGRFQWPLQDAGLWTQAAVTYLQRFLPKLVVPAGQAVALSVVNLRSATTSSQAADLERQLNVLAIQQLSQESRLFVLERQKMQLLAEEKELLPDEAVFWNGRFLLEGTIDANGYSPAVVTISARLTPPKAGRPLLFDVSGSRTNLAEVINQLAARVNELLNLRGLAQNWTASEEAAQYLTEAEWALRWGLNEEAQAASDSAWALGNHDLDCAAVRIQSRSRGLKSARLDVQGSIHPAIAFNTNSSVQAVLRAELDRTIQSYPVVLFETNQAGICYLGLGNFPDRTDLDRARQALELFYDFSRTSTQAVLAVDHDIKTGHWINSKWYDVGLEALAEASEVLLGCSLMPPPTERPLADELAYVRELARLVANLISTSPSVRQRYFVSEEMATHDELGHTLEEAPNIFKCKVTWGALWQESPQDCIALYRELMQSPTFCYLHAALWAHGISWPLPVPSSDHSLEPPRLVAWNADQKTQTPRVWSDFVRELCSSTNLLCQLEGRALQFTDATTEQAMAQTFTDFFHALVAAGPHLVTNNIELFYLDWSAGELLGVRHGGFAGPKAPPALERKYYSEYRPKLEAFDQQYWTQTAIGARFGSSFEKQKNYLKQHQPFDFVQFNTLFGTPIFSKVQALELLPLVADYKSNLVVQAGALTGFEKAKANSVVAQVGLLEYMVNAAAHASAPISTPPNMVSAPPPSAIPSRAGLPKAQEHVTAALDVGTFSPLPWSKLIQTGSRERIKYSRISILSQDCMEERLILDFRFEVGIEVLDENGAVRHFRNEKGSAIALLNPINGSWDVIACPTVDIAHQSNYPARTVLLGGVLFTCDGGRIQKYDVQNQQWTPLAVSDGLNHELFALNGRLYAADSSSIFEILDGGEKTTILTSTRRRPAMSTLDTAENLGTPVLFADGNGLCAAISGKVYRWAQNNWLDLLNLEISDPPQATEQGTLLRFVRNEAFRQPSKVWIWPKTDAAPKLALYAPVGTRRGPLPASRPGPPASDPESERPIWKPLASAAILRSPVALAGRDIYFCVDQTVLTNQNGNWTALTPNGYHARLVGFAQGATEPMVLPLRFDTAKGPPPFRSSAGQSQPWMGFQPNSDTRLLVCGDTLFLGQHFVPGLWEIPLSQIKAAVALSLKGR